MRKFRQVASSIVFVFLIFSICSAHKEAYSTSNEVKPIECLRVPPLEFAGAAKTAVDAIKKAGDLVSKFEKKIGNSRLGYAILDCIDLLDSASEELSWIISAFQNSNEASSTSTSTSNEVVPIECLRVPLLEFAGAAKNAVDVIKKAGDLVLKFDKKIGNSRLRNAIPDCIDLLDSASEKIAWIISASQNFNGLARKTGVVSFIFSYGLDVLHFVLARHHVNSATPRSSKGTYLKSVEKVGEKRGRDDPSPVSKKHRASSSYDHSFRFNHADKVNTIVKDHGAITFINRRVRPTEDVHPVVEKISEMDAYTSYSFHAFQATGYLNVLAESYERRLADLGAQKDGAVRARDQALEDIRIAKRKVLNMEAALSRKETALRDMQSRAKGAEEEVKAMKASIELMRIHILKEKEDGIAAVEAQASSQLAKLKNYFDEKSKVRGIKVRGIVDFLPELRKLRSEVLEPLEAHMKVDYEALLAKYKAANIPALNGAFSFLRIFGDGSLSSVTSGVPPRPLTSDTSASG